MSRRNPIANVQTLTTIPKRSPRFLSSNSPEAFGPKTPKGHLESTRILHSSSTPLSSTSKPKGSNHNLTKLVGDEVSRKPTRAISVSINPLELKRSARLSKIENQQEGLNVVECKGGRVSKRVGKKVEVCSVVLMKNGVERTLGKSNLGIGDGNMSKSTRRNGSSASVNATVGVHLCKEVEGKIGKRVIRSGNLSKNTKRNVRSASVKAKLGADLSKEVEGKIGKRMTRSDSRRNECEDDKSNYNAKVQGDSNPTQGVIKLVEEKYVPRRKEQIGKKRKMSECNDKSECVKGWSEEQEQALQRAYFAAKPTPQFWKRVAKTVPGKSAQDCFDQIHSAHLTPPQAQRRSKAKKITPSPLSFSAIHLLNSPEPKSKRSRFSRLTQKAVRQLVQKQCVNARDEGADLFDIFEATADPSNGASQQPTSCCTPMKNKGDSSFQNSCHETSSADRKSLSRLNMSSGPSVISPLVLKQIKNKALYEKYIDQLHRRETKRKAALSRAAKQVASQTNKLGTEDGKVDALIAARNSLYFDASNAIYQFQQSQMNAMHNCDLSDDDHLGSDDGED